MSPFFHNFRSKSPATPSGQEDGTRGNPGKTAESRRAWGSVGRREGKGQGQRARAKGKDKGQGQRARTKGKDKGQGQKARTKGKDKGQEHGLELDMDKVRVGGDRGIGGFLEWWGWEFGWSSYGILIGEMWDGWID